MAYDEQTWADGETGGTPLSADRLNHIETGLAATAGTADAAAAGLAAKAPLAAPALTGAATLDGSPILSESVANGTYVPHFAADDNPTAPAEGRSATYFVTSAVTWPDGLKWSTDPDGGVAPTITQTALVTMFTYNGTTRAVLGATFPDDVTNPTAGSLAAAVGQASVNLTVSGAADETALHAMPYAFTMDGGTTWTAWQASPTHHYDGLTADTAYTFQHKVRDAAGNESTGTPIGATTSAAWTPVDLATLAAWFDAADAATITASGGAVSTWADKSGYGQDVSQATSAYQPTTGSATINGQNALAFDGGDKLAWASPLSIGTTNTVILVTTPTSGTSDYIFEDRKADDGDSRAIITGFNAPFEFYSFDGTGRFTIGAGTETGPHVVGFVRDGDAVTGRMDGAASGSTTLTSTAVAAGNATTLGGSSADGAEGMVGQIAEVVICDSALTGADLTNLETYLKAKWGIA